MGLGVLLLSLLPSSPPTTHSQFSSVFTSLFSVTVTGSNQRAVASGWLPGSRFPVFADHFRCLSRPATSPSLISYDSYDKNEKKKKKKAQRCLFRRLKLENYVSGERWGCLLLALGMPAPPLLSFFLCRVVIALHPSVRPSKNLSVSKCVRNIKTVLFTSPSLCQLNLINYSSIYLTPPPPTPTTTTPWEFFIKSPICFKLAPSSVYLC